MQQFIRNPQWPGPGYVFRTQHVGQLSATGDYPRRRAAFPLRFGLFTLVALLLGGLVACQRPSAAATTDWLPYTTASDSTLHYYRLGWRQIMDEGCYGDAEVSFRRALAFDPDFLVGQAVLARLSVDGPEREAIYRTLTDRREELGGDERRIFEVYRDLVAFTNLRSRRPDSARALLATVLERGEERLRSLVYTYPEEVYLKCEYLEVIHSNRGAAAARDSLAHHTRSRHADNPFLLGLAASLEAELGHFDRALELARSTETAVADPTAPKSYVVYAGVYVAMDSLDRAATLARRAARLDPRNLDASRLVGRIGQ